MRSLILVKRPPLIRSTAMGDPTHKFALFTLRSMDFSLPKNRPFLSIHTFQPVLLFQLLPQLVVSLVYVHVCPLNLAGVIPSLVEGLG